jgi:pimeloyl-ACP methyl ester carboxylesterase
MNERAYRTSDAEAMISVSAISVPVDAADRLAGELSVPSNAIGLVVFAHGSGSSRTSPRNQFVAERLQQADLATVLTDLLTSAEDTLDRNAGTHRFDIALLARRLERIIDWVDRDSRLATLPVGLFGASTGAAAALVAAAHRPSRVAAVVSRGGRPDLAGGDLASVTAPTMLIVGSRDQQVLELNRAAAQTLIDCHVDIVDGATHLFEEPGALERVADLATAWFVQHLATAESLKR